MLYLIDKKEYINFIIIQVRGIILNREGESNEDERILIWDSRYRYII
jgi:hypothetical protein